MYGYRRCCCWWWWCCCCLDIVVIVLLFHIKLNLLVFKLSGSWIWGKYHKRFSCLRNVSLLMWYCLGIVTHGSKCYCSVKRWKCTSTHTETLALCNKLATVRLNHQPNWIIHHTTMWPREIPWALNHVIWFLTKPFKLEYILSYNYNNRLMRAWTTECFASWIDNYPIFIMKHTMVHKQV